MFTQIVPQLIEYSKHLNITIKELQQQILQMEQFTNKTNTHRKPLEMKYLQHKLSMPTNTSIPDINNDIDKILITAEQFLNDPNKTFVEPKKNEISIIEPPKRNKQTYEPYKQKKQIMSRKSSQKKLSPQKSYNHKRTNSLYKQEVTPKITQVQPPIKYSQQQRESTKSFKDQSRTYKQQQQQQQQLSPPKLNSIHDKNSILIEDQSKPKPPIPNQIRKQPQQPYLQLQPIQIQQTQQLQQSQSQQQLSSKDAPSQSSVLRKLEFSGFKELSRLKRMKEAVYIEYQQSYSYFRDKEQKARARFLTKYHQHMNERKKVLQQQAYCDKQTLFFLTDQIKSNYFTFIEEQLTINQPKTLLILKYSEQIQQTIDTIVFDEELLKNLKRINKNNIGKISLTELIDIFKLWSQIQIIRQNYQQLTQFIQPIPELTYELIKWLALKPKKSKNEKLQQQSKTLIILNQNQLAQTQEEAIEINKLIINQRIFEFLWDILQKLVFSKQQLETSLSLFKCILQMITKTNCSVYIFKQSDLIF